MVALAGETLQHTKPEASTFLRYYLSDIGFAAAVNYMVARYGFYKMDRLRRLRIMAVSIAMTTAAMTFGYEIALPIFDNARTFNPDDIPAYATGALIGGVAAYLVEKFEGRRRPGESDLY